jgi:hypothetical protein
MLSQASRSTLREQELSNAAAGRDDKAKKNNDELNGKWNFDHNVY